MATRKETERTKFIQEKCQSLLTQMLRDEDNKYCVDCDAKGKFYNRVKCKKTITTAVNYRSKMGVLEPGRISLHPLRWYSSKLRSSHI